MKEIMETYKHLEDSRIDEEFRSTAYKALQELKSMGYTFVPYCGIRTPLEQAKEWRKGRSTWTINRRVNKLRKQGCDYLADCIVQVGPQHGKKSTGAIPGLSWHQYGGAMDCYYLKNNKIDWNDISAYKIYRKICKKHGLHRAFVSDWVHVQVSKLSGPHKVFSMKQINDLMIQKFGAAIEV